jgi:glycerophosphoryl diester phosphodiesterase
VREIRKLWRPIVLVLLLFAAFVYLNNTKLWLSRLHRTPALLAHRGIAQQFDTPNLTNDTCTATRMMPPTHGYLANTTASIQASFEAGADVVEFDVHPTTDGQFAVFHDWTLDCRTEGYGITHEHAMAELKKLDIGYRYTADGGKTFPFRGKGIGLMPSLDGVLQAFPGRSFLINIKSNDPSEGEKLAAALGHLAPERRSLLMAYGGDRPIAVLARLPPDVTTMSRGSLKACLISYIAYGWTGFVPQACSHTLVLVPINVAPWLWGWPDRFLTRMKSASSPVFVLGPYYGGDFSTGIDTLPDIACLPDGYSGGVLTNEIEVVSRKLKLEGR